MRRLALALAVLAVTACSDGGEPQAARTVAVTMKNVAFSPATLSVAKGETVTFEFTNEDSVRHDAFVGDAAAQADHEKDMRSGDGHGGHGGDDAVTVEPGKTATLTHTFDEAGTVEIGCHEPGHYGGGMKIVVTVT
ncbi:MAG TPA: cupredoxin domain-containing protein [Frankiaceae bacterium]|nr:cupredoxin domain-containing protein [Frankiaceae bacterium]